MIHFSKLKSQVLFKKLNIYFIYILLISISGFSILFSPQPDPNISYKQEYVKINKYMGFQINIDANVFVSSAADLQLIFAENQARQNRPLYILMGSILYYPFNTLLNLINYNEVTFESTVGKKNISDSLIIGNSLLDNGVSLIQIINNLSNLFFQLLYREKKTNSFKYTGLNKIITKNINYYNKKYSMDEIKNAILILRNYDIIYKSSTIKDSIILNIVMTKICKGIK